MQLWEFLEVSHQPDKFMAMGIMINETLTARGLVVIEIQPIEIQSKAYLICLNLFWTFMQNIWFFIIILCYVAQNV